MLLRRLPTTAAAGAAAGAGASTRTLVTHAAPLARASWHRAAARCGPAALRLPSLVHEPPRRRPADPWDGQAATFASYTGRGKPTRTRVREQTEAEEETRYNTLAQRHDESVSEQQRQQSVAGERQMDSLGDAGLKTFMANVYMTTGGCIGMAAVGSALPIIGVVPMLNPWIPCIGMIGTYMYLQMRTDERTNPTKRAALLGACTMFAGMSLTPALVVYSAMDPTIAPVAFGLTCLIFGGSTAGALSEHRPPHAPPPPPPHPASRLSAARACGAVMPKRSLMVLAPVLGGGAMLVFGVSLLSIFWPNPIFTNIWLYGGLLLATGMVAYDTQNAIRAYEDGDRDHVSHSLDFFMNFVMIFRRMLMLLGIRSD